MGGVQQDSPAGHGKRKGFSSVTHQSRSKQNVNVKRMYMYLNVLDEKSRQAVMSEDVKALKAKLRAVL